MITKGRMGILNLKRLCPVCSKKRIPRLFPAGSRSCELCKIAKRSGIKKERREASSRTWIKRLDQLVGARVRSRGICEDTRTHNCAGVFQWAHGLSRRYHAIRWDMENGFCLCAGAHKFYTDRPLEWESFLVKNWSEDGLRNKKIKALSNENIDYKALYESLKGL